MNICSARLRKGSGFLVLGSYIFLAFLACEHSSSHQVDQAVVTRSGPEQETPVKPKGVEHLFTIGDDTTEILYNVTSMAVHSDSVTRLYVLDSGVHRLKLFDASGKLAAAVGSRGKGPGEFRNPTFLACVDDQVIVSEQFSPRAHLFTLDLEYLRDLNLEVVPVDLSTVSDSLLLVATVYPKPELSLQVGVFSLDRPGFKFWNLPTLELPKELAQGSTNPSSRLLWFFASVAGRGERVWIAYHFFNQLWCAQDGRVIWQKSFDNLPSRADVSEGTASLVPSTLLFKDVTTDRAGNGYVLLGGSAGESGSRVYVLNENGDHIDTLVLPYRARALQWAQPDRLYAVASDRIRIHVYRLTTSRVSSPGPQSAESTEHFSERRGR